MPTSSAKVSRVEPTIDGVLARIDRAADAVRLLAEMFFVKSTDELPQCPGVYAVFYKAKLIYIGQSRQLRSRWVGHDLRMILRVIGVRLKFVPCNNHVSIERQLIEHLRPKMNGMSADAAAIFRWKLMGML